MVISMDLLLISGSKLYVRFSNVAYTNEVVIPFHVFTMDISRLRDQNGHVIEHTEPVCCPCGSQHRVPSSCGTFFDKMVKGKANTAHCVRFPGFMFLELRQVTHLGSASEYK